MFDTEDQARIVARTFALGDYIAEVQLPSDGPLRFEKTRGAGHYTVWAEPDRLLECVTAVRPVEQGRQGNV